MLTMLATAPAAHPVQVPCRAFASPEPVKAYPSASPSCDSDAASVCTECTTESKVERSITPPTPPISSSALASPKKSGYLSKVAAPVGSSQDEYLQFLEPSAVYPPKYDLLPPGGCPSYPIMASHKPEDNVLPIYSPAIYKIAMVSRKVEWLSPYEPSPTRSWKNVIMELNLTQLNFYHVPSTLEVHLLNFRPTPTCDERLFNQNECDETSAFKSYLTTDADLQFLKYCQRLGLVHTGGLDTDAGCTYGFDEELFNSLTNNNNPIPLNAKAKDIKRNKRLIRSYSLQHSRHGLATDYKKKPDVLRLRIESEQILINFQGTRDLIDWNMAIGIGKDVSLDILEREAPRYRTVPRRRRRNRNDTESLGFEDLLSRSSRRIRAQSDPATADLNFKGKLSKLTSRFRNNSITSKTKSYNSKKELSTLVPSGASLQRSRSRSAPTFTLDVYENDTDRDNDEDDEEDEVDLRAARALLVNSPPPNRNNRNFTEDDDEEDIQNMSDLQNSDDDDEDEEYEETFEPTPESNTGSSENSFRRNTKVPSSSFSSSDVKWRPAVDKNLSQRKFYRNCVRCIKPLTMEDSWVSKSLVKPTTLSPLNFTYLRNMKYAPNGIECFSSTSSLSSLVSNGSSLLYTNGFSGRKRSLSLKDSIFQLPETSLARICNHYLKEYTVGTHGLIPKEI